MNLLILLNGHRDTVLSAHGMSPDEFDTVKIDEKDLANHKKIRGIIRGGKYGKVFFGCIELELQRFQAFMMAYIFLSGIHKGALIDEAGNIRRYSILKFLFYTIPMLGIEAIVSVFVVLLYYLKLGVLRMKVAGK